MKWNLKVRQVQVGYYTVKNDNFLQAEKEAKKAFAKDVERGKVGSVLTEVREVDDIDIAFDNNRLKVSGQRQSD